MLCFRALMMVAFFILSACSATGNGSAKWREKVYSGSVTERVSTLPQRQGQAMGYPVWLKRTDGYMGIGPSNGLGPGFGE